VFGPLDNVRGDVTCYKIRRSVNLKDGGQPIDGSAMFVNALGTMLACLAIAHSAYAQTPASESNGGRDAGSLPIPDAKAERRQPETPVSSPSLCQALASAAAENGLPLEFFARIIWQESRFKSDAVGPVTRSGQQALGIAQFMPSLRDAFNPFEALPKSAEFLHDLQLQFGNLGLAAAAYNAGPQRVRDWLTGKRTLPAETQAYVQKVTGHSAEEWTLPRQIALTVSVPNEMSCAVSVRLTEKPRPSSAAPSARSAWVAQLIGDSSETAALARFREMQSKLRSVLGNYEPVIVRTITRAGVGPTWTRVRIEFDTRRAAESLCSKLEATHEPCLVQRNSLPN
jgi:Transglycosylase SLT domain